MFGTLQEELSEEEYEPIRYGLTKPLQSQNPANIIFHEWVSIWKDVRRKDIRWNIKLKYLFKPPGWSHDGTRMTSDELRITDVNEVVVQRNSDNTHSTLS